MHLELDEVEISIMYVVTLLRIDLHVMNEEDFVDWYPILYHAP